MADITETPDLQPLLSRCAAGDDQAIEMLVRQFETSVFRLALSVLDDPMEATEIAQETFLSAINSLSHYQEKASFKSWLFTITMNLSRSRLRKRKTLDRLRNALAGMLLLETRKTDSPEEAVIQNEKERAAWQALSRLDEKHRLPIILRYFHEMPINEIAQILNVSEGTIHSRLHYAREKLQANLKPLLTGEESQ